MRQEARRFESVCPDIQSLYDLLEEIDNVPLKRKMRELVNRIEGKFKYKVNFFGGVNRSKPRSYRRFVGCPVVKVNSWLSCFPFEYANLRYGSKLLTVFTRWIYRAILEDKQKTNLLDFPFCCEIAFCKQKRCRKKNSGILLTV